MPVKTAEIKKDPRRKRADKKRVSGRVKGEFRYASNTGFCSLPISGDTYRNCAFGCLFCYERQTPNQHLRDMSIKPRDHKTMFDSLFNDPIIKYFVIEQGAAVRIGALTDPFPAMESWYRNTERMIRTLASIGAQVQMSTKAPGNIDDAHIEALLACDKSMVRVSFSTLDDEKAKVLEPGSIAPSARLEEMKRLSDAGIEIGIRVSPLIHTFPEWSQQESYDRLAEAGVRVLSVDMLKMSVTWRHTWDPMIWTVVLGCEDPPNYDQWQKVIKNKQSTLRKWAERKEREFYAPLQSLDRHKYQSSGYGFILYDPLKLRGYLMQIRDFCHNASAPIRFGICSYIEGMHNIDIGDGHECPAGPGMCGCLSKGWAYDEGSLMSAWHLDRWDDYILPEVIKYPGGAGMNHFINANDPFLRPLVLRDEYPTGLYPAAESAPDPEMASKEVFDIKGGSRAYRPHKDTSVE